MHVGRAQGHRNLAGQGCRGITPAHESGRQLENAITMATLHTRRMAHPPIIRLFRRTADCTHTHTHNAAGTSVAGFRGIPTCPANDPSVGDPARLSHTRAMWDPRGAPVEVASGLLLGRSSPAGPDAERRCETANSTQHPTPMALTKRVAVRQSPTRAAHLVSWRRP